MCTVPLMQMAHLVHLVQKSIKKRPKRRKKGGFYFDFEAIFSLKTPFFDEKTPKKHHF